MEEQYKKTFDQMVDSLKMYQRYLNEKLNSGFGPNARVNSI